MVMELPMSFSTLLNQWKHPMRSRLQDCILNAGALQSARLLQSTISKNKNGLENMDCKHSLTCYIGPSSVQAFSTVLQRSAAMLDPVCA